MARLVKYVELSRYNVRLSVGEIKSFEGEDGIARQKFSPLFELWAAPYRLTYHEQVDNQGPNQQEDQVYAIKDLQKVRINQLVKINDVEYTVVRVSPWADTRDPRGYDLITLERGNGVNRTYRNAGGE